MWSATNRTWTIKAIAIYWNALVLGVWLLLLGCSSKKENPEIDDTDNSNAGLNPSFQQIGRDSLENPWITDLAIVDLDRDGLLDILVCEGRLGELSWIRQTSLDTYEEISIEGDLEGIASADAVDFDGDNDLDLLVGCMGIVTPSTAPLGQVLVFENKGAESFEKRILLEGVTRVNFLDAGDLDGDGDMDLSVAQFGYHEGGIQWLENHGNWTFEGHQLLDLPGAIHSPCVDLDGDGDLDIVAIVSQDSEEIYAFYNNGEGSFQAQILYGSTNKDFGSSGLTLADLDQDDDIDIVYANGDGFDYVTPGSRPWHGVQWLENLGRGNQFKHHRIGDFLGAYSPVVRDYNGDGNLDIIVSSGFNDWSNDASNSIGVFLNNGSQDFQRVDLATKPTHIVVMDAADMNADGSMDLITGGFYFYPPFRNVQRVCLWELKDGNEGLNGRGRREVGEPLAE